MTGLASAARSPGRPIGSCTRRPTRCGASLRSCCSRGRRMRLGLSRDIRLRAASASGSAPMARAAIRSAASRYFSISTGEMVSTSPMLSKPSPESSVGKSFSARKSTASRSRMVFEYSVRFSRRAVTRPGSGFTLRSAFSNSPCTNFIRASICASSGAAACPWAAFRRCGSSAGSAPSRRGARKWS